MTAERQKLSASTAPDSTGDATVDQTANRMWGGRFAAGPAEVMEQINASISFDQRLYAQDIAAPSSREMIACSISILQWALEPAMSWA